MEKRNIKRPKRKLNKKRFFGAIIVAGVSVLGIGKGIGAGIEKISEKISHKDSMYYNQDLVGTDVAFDYNTTFDNFKAGEYIFNEDINLLIDDKESRRGSIFSNLAS